MKELKIKQIADGLSYSRESILGKGAFGQVYLGFDDTRKAPCAFKIVNLQKLSQQVNAQSLLKKIKDEIVNMQLIKNDYVIQFYQAKKSTNNIYIVCEYCNGTSLAKYIENKQYLTEPQALTFFKEILKGFKHLHQNKIVHRDLKPANLLLHNNQIKIGDLGFSKVTEHHEQMLQSIVGTPLYMSPQIFDRQGYTQKTDIWSLGAILFEMLYGRNPWVGCKNLYELKQKIRSEIAFPNFPHVSNKVKQTIRKMLRVQQSDRINWQGLFTEYLQQNSFQTEQTFNKGYIVSIPMKHYYKLCFNLQSYLQLPKLAKQLSLLSEQQLQTSIGVYNKPEQFYLEYLFISKNAELVNEFYDFYLEKHNEISFLIVLNEKLSELAQNCYLELSVFSYCLILLIYRYSLSILEQLYSLDRLAMPDLKHQPIYGKLLHQKILLALFKRSYQVLLQQYQRFKPFFESVISKIKNHSIFSIIQKDLSGIYSSDQNQKRVLKFFTNNYLKKVYNILKNLVKVPSTMISQEEEVEQTNFPSKEITLIKMIQEYLNNSSLFVVTRQSKGTKRNLTQMLYEWETSVKQQFYQTLQKTPFMQEQSINSFLKKQIVWKPIFLQQFV